MSKDILRYDQMVEAALRGVVRETIAQVSTMGLPGGHSLYITFRTGAPGVDIPDWLKAQYPDAMTIVIEHQYWDLGVMGDKFHVTLSFKGRRNRLLVPFAAIVAFHDPGVQFGLRFDELAEAASKAAGELAKSGIPGTLPPGAGAAKGDGKAGAEGDKPAGDKADAGKAGAKPDPASAAAATAQVVSLDSFRKK